MRRSTALVAVIVSVGLFACAANAEVLCWDFTVHPSAEKVPMVPFSSDAQGLSNGSYTPYGGTVAGTGLQGDGTAIFADAPSESANSGFVIGGWTGGFTFDVRVKVLEDIVEGKGKSMSIADCTSNGRGIKLRPNSIELVDGSGVVRTFTPVDLTQWQIIRFSASCNISVDVCLWDANTNSWVSLGNQGLGGSGWNIMNQTAAGIGIGSLAGSSTQSGKFQIDWARVDNAQALGGTGSPLGPCGSDKCESTVSPAGPQVGNGWVGGLPAVFAKVDLGIDDVADGLNGLPNNGGFDGNTMATVMAGRGCRRNINPAIDGYIFFDIDNDRAYQLAPGQGDVYIVADYYDMATGSVDLQYDAGPGNEYAGGGSVPMTGTNTWKRAVFHVADAYFGTGQAWGADFRFGTGGGILHLDNVMVARGQGPEFEYLLFNSGTVAINSWDAVQANADGTTKVPADTWVTVTKTPASGPLAAGATATIKATTDTTDVAAGTYPVYLKFTDDCVFAGYTEAFAYADGSALAGQGSWVGSGDTAPLVMEAGELKLNGSGAGESAHSASHGIDLAGYDGVFSVKVKVRTGGALPGRETNNFWALRAVDANGTQLGYWQGTPTTVRARNPLDAGQASAVQTLDAAFKVMEMKINTATKTTEYYFDGALVISYPFDTAGGLAGIRFERISGAETSASEYVYFDDAEVTASERYHLRRFDVNVVGCSYAVEPGSAFSVSGGCTDSTTKSFAVINTGVTTITSLSVDTVAPGSGPLWPHYTFSWLPGTDTWPSTIPCNLAPGESLEVPYTVDWTQLVAGFPQNALFKFNIAGCPDALGETKIALTADKIAVPQSYQVVSYPAVLMPQEPNSAGPGQQFDVFDTTASTMDWTLLTALTDPNALDAEDQKALRVLDTTTTKTKFYSTPAANIVQAIGATVVARVKTVSFDGTARYGNVWIYGPDISTEVFWGGPTGELRETRGSRVILPGDTQYHLIRVTSKDYGTAQSPNIVINVYFDEDPIPKITVTNADPYDSPIPQGVSGFGFGVLAGSADAQDLQVDCFNGTDAGAFAPGEEVGCLGRSLTVCNPCHSPFADVDDDGDVDQADFAVLQLCYTGSGATAVPANPEYCACLDHADDDNNPETPPGADGNIDSFDVTAFERCASGPGVPADPDCQ